MLPARRIAALVAATCLPVAAFAQRIPPRPHYTIYAVTEGNNNTPAKQQLVRFDSHTPGVVTAIGPTGALVTDIDFHPRDGRLYGYGYDGPSGAPRVYTLSLTTGAATPLFGVPAAKAAGPVGFDVDPTNGTLRVASQNKANLRLSVADGAAAVDAKLAWAPGDANQAKGLVVNGAAYARNVRTPSAGVTLYAIDANTQSLVTLPAPSDGRVHTVGSLGIPAPRLVGFDAVIVGGGSVAFLVADAQDGGPPEEVAKRSRLYRVNLATGLATVVGEIGPRGFPDVYGIAVAPPR